IARQAKTHTQMSRAALYRRFSPSKAQVAAFGAWLQARGFRITHVGRDRLTISARASTATIEKTLGTKIAWYRHPAVQFQSRTVKPYAFFANTKPARLPARFGVNSISGLTDVSSRLFYTDYQLASSRKSGSKSAFVRSGG